MAEKLLLVDAPNHAFRAYHAIQSDMRAPDGFPTRALYGFTRVLLNLVRDQKPDYVALVFDVGQSFRNALYPAYKGQRPDMPADLAEQWDELRPLAEAFGFHVLALPDTEADDVIGTLARRFAGPDVRVGIVSGDKDFSQLVNEHIYVLDLMKNQEIGPDEVRERWGVGPDRIVDLLALMGDTSDNVPGVPGVGEKKAAQFITKYGHLDGVLERAAEIGGKTGQAVIEAAEHVRLARRLVTIHCEIECATTLEELRPRPRDEAELVRRLTRYNFRTLMQDLKLDPATVPAPLAAAAPSGAVDLRTVWGPSPLETLTPFLRAAERVVVHVEDVGGKPGRLFFAWVDGADRAAMVPVDASTRPWILATLADPEIQKVGFDLKSLHHRLGPVAGIAGDLLIADYLRFPEQKHGLDEVCRRHLQHSIGTDWGEGIRTMLQLDRTLSATLGEWGMSKVYEEIELPLLPILARMEDAGILVDRASFGGLAETLERRIRVHEKEIHELAGEEFLIGSTQQLAAILYEKLGLKGAKKIKTGLSTDADTLDKMRDQHPLPGAILAWREATKLKNTYVDALPTYIAADGRIHTHYDQAVAATGRLSSSDPNLQNIPVRTEEGRRIRDCFVARPGTRFVSADYSQIELRILAHYVGGPLAESFRNGEDIHRRTASEIFGVSPALVSTEMRRAAKAINFGIVYGMGAFRLANDLRIPRAEAQSYIEGYFARYPQVRAYIDAACARARETGYSETLYGRRRPIPGLDAGNQADRAAAERIAVNSPIQGSAADIVKLAMIKVDRALRGTGAQLLLQVHDELVLEVPDAEVDSVAAMVKAEMEHVAELDVPLVVDTGHAPTWGGAH
jgi:DNA polymerase-1